MDEIDIADCLGLAPNVAPLVQIKVIAAANNRGGA
jgi:hypothetical protein